MPPYNRAGRLEIFYKYADHRSQKTLLTYKLYRLRRLIDKLYTNSTSASFSTSIVSPNPFSPSHFNHSPSSPTASSRSPPSFFPSDQSSDRNFLSATSPFRSPHRHQNVPSALALGPMTNLSPFSGYASPSLPPCL